jgi:hypothetical protein
MPIADIAPLRESLTPREQILVQLALDDSFAAKSQEVSVKSSLSTKSVDT